MLMNTSCTSDDVSRSGRHFAYGLSGKLEEEHATHKGSPCILHIKVDIVPKYHGLGT